MVSGRKINGTTHDSAVLLVYVMSKFYHGKGRSSEEGAGIEDGLGKGDDK